MDWWFWVLSWPLWAKLAVIPAIVGAIAGMFGLRDRYNAWRDWKVLACFDYPDKITASSDISRASPTVIEMPFTVELISKRLSRSKWSVDRSIKRLERNREIFTSDGVEFRLRRRQ